MKDTFKFCPLCKHPLRRSEIDSCKRLVCPECGWIHYENPLPVVVCVARNKKGKILITKRNVKPGINKWALPGGFIELGENPEYACLRELKEETGIEGRVVRLTGVYVQKTRAYGSILVIGYEVNVLKEAIFLNNELKEARFIDRKDLPRIPFATHRKIIEEVYKNGS